MALFPHRDIFISLLWTCHSGKIIDVKKKQFTATEQSHCYYYQKHPGFCYCDESKYLLGKRLIMLNLNVPNYMTLHIKGYFDWTVKKCGEQRFDYPIWLVCNFPMDHKCCNICPARFVFFSLSLCIVNRL